MISIDNGILTAKFNEIGAELKSLTCNGKEYVWKGEKESWNKSCPILFPICSGLKNDTYTFKGVNYNLSKHGYVKELPFTVEENTNSSIVFLHKSNDLTKAKFPFDYELRIIYTLSEKTIKIDYCVKNKSNETMYFNIGSHEGYSTPEGIENYEIVFPEKVTLNSSLLEDNLLSNETVRVLENGDTFSLNETYFDENTLIFKNINLKSMILKNKLNDRAIKIDCDGSPHLIIWHVLNAKFICLELWNGIPDTVGSSYDITEKESIIPLLANAEYKTTHSITVIK